MCNGARVCIKHNLTTVRKGVSTCIKRTLWTSLATAIVLGGLALLVNASSDAYKMATTNLRPFDKYVDIMPWIPFRVGGYTASRGLLYDKDVTALRDGADPSLISDVIPHVGGTALCRNGSQTFTGWVTGTSPGYLDYQNIKLTAGTMFTEAQYASDSRVVVLGRGIVTPLFGEGVNPVNSQVLIGRHSYRIIGVTDSGMGYNVAIMPLGTARATLLGGITTVQGIELKVVNSERRNDVIKYMTEILDKRHHARSPFTRDYTFQSTAWMSPDIPKILSLIQSFRSTIILSFLAAGALCIFLTALVVDRKTRTESYNSLVRKSHRAGIYALFICESAITAAIGWTGWLACRVADPASSDISISDQLSSMNLTAQSFARLLHFDMSALASLPGLVALSAFMGFIAAFYPAFRNLKERGTALVRQVSA